MTDPISFLEAIRAEFPELRAELDEEGVGDLPHLSVGLFADHVQGAIRSGDLDLVARAFRLAGRAWDDADPALADALAVSFLERLDFRREAGHGAAARALLPANLRAVPGDHAAQWARMFPGKSPAPATIPRPRVRRHSS